MDLNRASPPRSTKIDAKNHPTTMSAFSVSLQASTAGHRSDAWTRLWDYLLAGLLSDGESHLIGERSRVNGTDLVSSPDQSIGIPDTEEGSRFPDAGEQP